MKWPFLTTAAYNCCILILLNTQLGCEGKSPAKSTGFTRSEGTASHDDELRVEPITTDPTADIEYKRQMKDHDRLMEIYRREVAQWDIERKKWNADEREKRRSFTLEEDLGGAIAPASALSPKIFPKPSPTPPLKPRYRDHDYPPSDFPDAITIMPGIGVWDCQIGDTKEVVTRTFGPDIDSYLDKYGFAVRFDNNKVLRIGFSVSNTSKYRFEGVRPDDALDEVVKYMNSHYGPLIVADTNESGATEYKYDGVIVFFRNGKPSSINVEVPQPELKAAIIRRNLQK